MKLSKLLSQVSVSPSVNSELEQAVAVARDAIQDAIGDSGSNEATQRWLEAGRSTVNALGLVASDGDYKASRAALIKRIADAADRPATTVSNTVQLYSCWELLDDDAKRKFSGLRLPVARAFAPAVQRRSDDSETWETKKPEGLAELVATVSFATSKIDDKLPAASDVTKRLAEHKLIAPRTRKTRKSEASAIVAKYLQVAFSEHEPSGDDRYDDKDVEDALAALDVLVVGTLSLMRKVSMTPEAPEVMRDAMAKQANAMIAKVAAMAPKANKSQTETVAA